MTEPIVIDGRTLPLLIQKSERSTRLSLRVNRSGDGLVVATPPHVPEATLRAFVLDKTDWIVRQLHQTLARVPFVPGALIPFEGTLYELRPNPEAARGVRLDTGTIHVSGDEGQLAERLGGWLKARARDRLVDRVTDYAQRLNAPFTGLSLKDTTSRWGSCASSGKLAFSWRLIMAPAAVLEYVAAHEVAHLVEFNHSPRFWALVDGLVPDTRQHRHWLKTEGRTLHRYG